MPIVRFDKAQIMHLLQRYKENDILWNPRNPKHRNVELKRKTWEKIADEFFTSTLEIKKKIKSLRASYYIERKKMAEGEIQQPTLFYYYAFEYIKEQIQSKKPLLSDDTSSGIPSSPNEKLSPKPPTPSKPKATSAKDKKPITPGKKVTPKVVKTTKPPAPTEHINTRLNEIEEETQNLKDLAEESPSEVCDFSDSEMSTDSKPIHYIKPVSKTDDNKSVGLSPLCFKSTGKQNSILSTFRSSQAGGEAIGTTTITDKISPMHSPRQDSNLLKKATNCLSQASSIKDEDIFSCIAKVWAEKLSFMQSSQRIIAEKAINEIIFQAEIGTLDLDLLQKISSTSLKTTDGLKATQ